MYVTGVRLLSFCVPWLLQNWSISVEMKNLRQKHLASVNQKCFISYCACVKGWKYTGLFYCMTKFHRSPLILKKKNCFNLHFSCWRGCARFLWVRGGTKRGQLLLHGRNVSNRTSSLTHTAYPLVGWNQWNPFQEIIKREKGIRS